MTKAAERDAPRRDEAFRSAITPLMDVAVRVLRRLGIRDRDLELDDALQMVLVAVDRRFDELRGTNELRAYLCAVCVSIARDVGRRRKRHAARQPSSDDVDASPSSTPTPEDALGHKEQVAILEKLLAAMTEERREVFVLYEIEGLTAHEIAKHLGIPLGTVASRLRRGREDFLSMVTRMQARRARGSGGR